MSGGKFLISIMLFKEISIEKLWPFSVPETPGGIYLSPFLDQASILHTLITAKTSWLMSQHQPDHSPILTSALQPGDWIEDIREYSASNTWLSVIKARSLVSNTPSSTRVCLSLHSSDSRLLSSTKARVSQKDPTNIHLSFWRPGAGWHCRVAKSTVPESRLYIWILAVGPSNSDTGKFLSLCASVFFFVNW